VALAAGQLALSTAKALDRVEKAKSAKQKPARGAVPAAGKNQTQDATEFLNNIRSQQKLFDAYKAAIERLAAEPDAEDANAVVGRHLCFTKRDWNKGLPSLAKGSDDQLRKLAQRELAVQASGDVSGALEAAGAWWDFMESKAADLTALELAAVKDHAGRQYAAQLERITDPTNRALAEKRAAEVSDGGPAAASSFASLADEDNDGRSPRRGKKAELAVFAIVPEPRGLSKELYPLLPTDEEIKVISNHLTLPDDQVYQAAQGFRRRLERHLPAAKWSDVDAKFIVALNDVLQGKLGQDDYRRKWERVRIASVWLLGSPDDLEFVRRARTIPTTMLEDLNYYVSKDAVKSWLLENTAQFPTDDDKAAALDRILQAGFQFRGITEFRAALQQQQQQ
jgi:hypothetical protein